MIYYLKYYKTILNCRKQFNLMNMQYPYVILKKEEAGY